MMKKLLKNPLILCLLAFVVALSFWLTPVQASAEEATDFDCTYSVPEKKPYFQYGAGEVIVYTAEEAAAAGIPEGYSDTVLSIKPVSSSASGSGVLLDFSALAIPVRIVDSISVRFYLGESSKNTGGKPQLRVWGPKSDEWVYQPGSTASKTGEWATETIENTNSVFEGLADEQGNLYKFELSVRVAEHVDFYIDSVKLNTKENDGVAPVISYDGGDEIRVALGADFALNATAYDAQEDCEKEVEYVWESGIELDENGTPKTAGEYLLTLRAVDYYGNVATKTITVRVIEPDVELPVIHLNFKKMYAQVGMIPILNFEVTDNQKVVEVTRVWSEGALDAKGALTEGTHTYTVTAKDDSNNQSVHTVTVYVTKDEPAYDNVIDEEFLTPQYIVSFDFKNGVPYWRGDKVKKPVDPIREDTEYYTYIFDGWYNGDVKWDFEKDVVLDNLNLIAKWTEIPIAEEGPDSSQSSGKEEDKDGSSSSTENETPSQSSGKEETSTGSSASDKTENQSGCSCALELGVVLPALLCVSLVFRKKKENE